MLVVVSWCDDPLRLPVKKASLPLIYSPLLIYSSLQKKRVNADGIRVLSRKCSKSELFKAKVVLLVQTSPCPSRQVTRTQRSSRNLNSGPRSDGRHGPQATYAEPTLELYLAQPAYLLRLPRHHPERALARLISAHRRLRNIAMLDDTRRHRQRTPEGGH